VLEIRLRSLTFPGSVWDVAEISSANLELRFFIFCRRNSSKSLSLWNLSFVSISTTGSHRFLMKHVCVCVWLRGHLVVCLSWVAIEMTVNQCDVDPLSERSDQIGSRWRWTHRFCSSPLIFGNADVNYEIKWRLFSLLILRCVSVRLMLANFEISGWFSFRHSLFY